MQCAKAAKKATFRDKETFMSLYATFVRPLLKYAVQAWSSWTIGVKEVFEKVQSSGHGH